jgi:hypothetical protein
VLPSEYPEVQSYAHLKHLLADHVDMQFEDVRVLLGLPEPGSSVGGNFATAALLFNLISGASVAFYKTSLKALKGKAGGSGDRFRGVLADHFPLAEISLAPETVLKVFYNYSRNPLAHSLGLGGPKSIEVFIAKKALSSKRIAELEDSPSLPKWSREALYDAGVQPGPSYRIGISGLYWGVHRMMQSILADNKEATRADEVAAKLGF